MKFYKETNFKEEPWLGQVPKDWATLRLKETLTLLRNGLTITQNKSGHGYPVTRIETISEEKVNPNKVGYITGLNEKELAEYRLIEGDILFSHINSLEHIGKTAIYEGVPKLLIHGMNLLLLRPDKNKVYPKFLLYLLRFYRMRNIFRAIAKKAVNQASINQTELARVKIPLPSFDEQQKIANILYCVDLAIQKVDEAIARAERLKKGLMQQLLTKGIGHKEFKETPIGKIPKTWKVMRLKDVAEQKKEIVIPTKENPSTPYVGLEHVDSGSIRINRHGKASDVKSTKFRFYRNDILYGKLRPYLDKVVLSEIDGLCSTDFIVIKTKKTIDPKFLVWIMHSRQFVNYAVSTMKGTNHPRTSWASISKYTIGLPPLFEQQKIAEILSSVDDILQLKRKRRKKLVRMKRRLMDLLLTGRVRVSV